MCVIRQAQQLYRFLVECKRAGELLRVAALETGVDHGLELRVVGLCELPHVELALHERLPRLHARVAQHQSGLVSVLQLRELGVELRVHDAQLGELPLHLVSRGRSFPSWS